MLSPKELDAQSPVIIDRWVDLDSEEFKQMDHRFLQFTKDIIRMGICVPDLFGRLWGKGDNCYYPLHDEYAGKNIGYRISKKAVN